jgi:hypothetical protein
MAVPTVAGLAIVGGLAIAHAGTAQEPGMRTLTLVQKKTKPTFVDLGRKSSSSFNPSPGDLTVFAAKLSQPDGTPAGRSQGYCVAADVRHRGEQCSYSFDLREGQIDGEGKVVYGRRFSIPVSGGTGAYEGARGSVAFTVGRRSDRLEIRLLP